MRRTIAIVGLAVLGLPAGRASAGPASGTTKPRAQPATASGTTKPRAQPATHTGPAPRAHPASTTAAGTHPDEPAATSPDEPRYGGPQGYLSRLSQGTQEVDRCASRTGLSTQERTQRRADHYDRGVVLYEQGDYKAAVREFVAAYCDKPHPSMFYNIGQAFERQLEYEKAVAYLERFIIEADPNDPNRRRAQIRVEVLSKLKARVRVATVPPGASVTLSSQSGVVARGRSNGKVPIEVRKGRYTMRVEMPGYQPVVQKVTAEIGQPYSYYFQLEHQKGVVRVVATPADARVFLGDRLVGIGSLVDTVPIGRYQLSVEAEGRPRRTLPFEVHAGRTTDLTVTLPARPRSGRWELVLASGVVLGGAAGTLSDRMFNQEDVVSSVVALAGLGLGFGGAYLAVPEHIPVGHSSFIIGSTAIGAAEGAVVSSIFSGTYCFSADAPPEQNGTVPSGCNDQAVSGAAVAGAAAGALFSTLTADRFDPDGGDAALINSGALWGGITGLLFWSSFDNDPQVFEPMVLAGLNLGVVVGTTVAARSTVSRGHVALIDLSGLGGMVVGFAVGQALSANDERLAHTTLVGTAAGLITGTWLTRAVDEPNIPLHPALSPASDGAGAVLSVSGSLP